MPNWVTNYVDIHHDDPAKLAEFKAIYAECSTFEPNEKRLFSSYLPCPAELLENGGWYDWCVQNWGTKWDACHLQPLIELDADNTIYLQFETAWSPPIAFFELLKEHGFEIKCQYVDEAFNFIGQWNDGFDECYNYDQMSNLPEYLANLYTPFEDEDDADKDHHTL